MIRLLVTILIGFPLLMPAQELKKVEKTDMLAKEKEVYYVLKSHPKIKQGSYQKILSNGTVALSGYYKHGLKDSVWTEYTNDGKLLYKGKYSKDVKTGVWEYYTYNEILEQKYDYDKKEMVYLRSAKKKLDNFRILNKDALPGSDIKGPVYIGGDYLMFRNLHYKMLSRPKAGMMEVVSVTFIIDEHGKTSGHHISDGADADMDAEALKVVKSIPDNWYPAQLNGKPVASEYTMPIMFKP
jgi:protein TonB